MKINNISNINNTTFKKAISVIPASRDGKTCVAWNCTERNIVKVLNDEKCDIYTKKEKKKIKEFFKPLLKDESTPVVYRQYDCGKFILSGQEAEDVLKINKFLDDAKKIEVPETEYIQAGGHDTDEGQMRNILKTFIQDVRDYAYPKMNALINKSFDKDKEKIFIDVINNDPNSTKAKAIIATVKTENGETQTTKLDLNA